MGGEPLLNPELPQIIVETRKAFPKAKIHILTNGMLCKRIDGSLLEEIRNCDVEVQVSLYKPLVHKKDELENFFQAQGIRYWISDPISYFGKYLNMEGNSNPRKSVSQCHASRCTFLQSGYIARCSLPFNIRHLNRRFGQNISMEHEWISIHDSKTKGYAIKKILRRPMDSCRFCGNIQWEKWKMDSVGNENPRIEDFLRN
jgi:hypothetical protein